MEKNESRKMGQDRILEGQHKDGTLIQVEVALVQVEIEGEKSVISLVRNAKQDTAWEFIKMTKFGKLFEEEEEEEEEEFFWDKSRMMVTKKGRLIPVLVSGSLMRSKSGEIQGIVLGAKDISQRQQMERELAESEERYRELYHRAPVMYHSISPDGIIRDCNQTELDTLGYDRNEYVGKPLMDFIAPRQRNKMQSAITTAIKKGKIEAETRFIRKNDSQIPVLVNAVWQYDDGGKPLFSRTMMFDISERKRLEDELFQAEKMATVGQLAAGVAHKMRNPLAIISSTAQMGKSKVEDSEQFYEIFNVIQRNAAEANNMVYELLNFAKPRVLNKKKNTLRKTLDRTYDLIKGDFTKNNIRFIKEYSHSRKKAVYDEDSLIEIVLNLYMNAIQAMQKGGAIKTSLDQMDGNMCIHIEDNGPGIKEEHQMQVFDPYFTTKDKGTGLGLTLCHQLINQQNGLITIQSKEGSGTRFSLFLPKEIGGGAMKTNMSNISTKKGIINV